MTDRLRRTVRRSTAVLVGTIGLVTATLDRPLGLAVTGAALLFLVVSFVAAPALEDSSDE